ncbi:uncharacterized protein LOC117322031 [Pecten maximus]|uniref:uncharacterized protein LOC117322031 n=1 Tax=Pecten maximus TaxID=6579 RepID=UPI001458AED4|nr:uncharacterized protein LOC117322031 [Pecten maximus]
MPGINVNNNEFTQFDSPADNKYEYITTDDYLYTEPLDLSIKLQPNVGNPFIGSGAGRSIDVFSRQDVQVVSTSPNDDVNIGKTINFDGHEAFGAVCVIQNKLPMPSLNTTHLSTFDRMNTDHDTARNVDCVEVNCYNPRSHLQTEQENDKGVLSRPSPRETEFDENANYIGLELKTSKSCLSNRNMLSQLDSNKFCENLQQESNGVVQHATRTSLWYHDRPQDTATATRSEVPYTATRSEVPYTATRSEVPYTATRSEVPYTATRSEFPYTATRSEGSCSATRSEFPYTATRSEGSCSATRPEIPYAATRCEDFCLPRHDDIQSGSQVQSRNTRQQERKGELPTPRSGSRIQDTFRSDGDVDWINSNLNHHKMDKERSWPDLKLMRESQDSREKHYPNASYNSNRDTHTEPEETMLMHMMYTQPTLGADGYSEEDMHFKRGGSSGRRLQCSYPMDSMKINLENKDVPLDLSCNKTYTIPRGSVPDQPISVGNFRPSFESSVRGLRPTFENFPDLQPKFSSSMCNVQSHFGIVNELPNVRKLNSSYLMFPGILTNLCLPDNIPELLSQPAIPNPGCIAYPQQPMMPPFDWSDPRVTGGAETWKATPYQPVPDVVPIAEHSTHPNQVLAAPGPVQLPDYVSDSFGYNYKSHPRRDSGSKNLSRKRTSRTKKKYKVLSQILESRDESEFRKIARPENCPLPSVKSGTSCTSFHVHPIAQTFPAMPHRHFMPGPSDSYLQPPSASVSLPCQQSCFSDNILRKKPPGISGHDKELFRPYMDYKETMSNRNPDMTSRMMNTGLQNSNFNVVGPPGKFKFQEGRYNDTGGNSNVRSYVNMPFHGNLDSQSVSSVNKAGYSQFGDTENVQQFQVPHDTGYQPVAPSWGQHCFNGDETNIFRHPNEINRTWFHGNQRQVLDHNRNIDAVTEHGKIGVEMSHTTKRSRISRKNWKNWFVGQ